MFRSDKNSYRPFLAASALALTASLVASCGQSEDEVVFEEPVVSAETPVPAPSQPSDEPLLSGNGMASAGVLVPPGPGEPGGLPDDRTPLDESAIEPGSIRDAGSVLEQYAFAMQEGDWQDAYSYWAEDGAASNMSQEEFVSAMQNYDEVHVMIGRPVEAETGVADEAIVPVQMYGRRLDDTVFNTIGEYTLVLQDGANGPVWKIASMDMRLEGEVTILEEN